MGTYTANLNLYKPTLGETGWGALVNTNFDTIDSIEPADIGAEPAITKNTAFNKNFEATASNFKVAGTASVGSLSTVARADHVHPAQTTVSGNAGSATKLATARTIGISGGATGTATSFDGSANITIPVTSLDATKLSGNIPSESLPTASETTKGCIKMGYGFKIESDGTMSVTKGVFPMMARLTDVDEGVGTLIKDNVYNGTLGQLPMGIALYNPDETHTTSVTCRLSNYRNMYESGTLTIYAKDVITLAQRQLYSGSHGVPAANSGGITDVTKSFEIKFTEIFTATVTNSQYVSGGIRSSPNSIYFGVGL